MNNMAKENNNEIINSLHSISPENSPPTEYIDWNKSKQTTVINLNTLHVLDFDFNEFFYNNSKIRDQISYPCVIQKNDIENIIKLGSIQHEESKLEIKTIIKYDPIAYSRHYDTYMKKKDIEIAKYEARNSISSEQELTEIVSAKKENDMAIETQINDTAEKYAYMGFKFRSAHTTLQKIWTSLFDCPAIDELHFWDVIKTVEIGEYTNLMSWKASPLYALYIMQTNEYIRMYNYVRDAILPHISDEHIKDSGIIHYIIFRGKTVFYCVVESPEFVVFMLEDGIINIPKYLVAKVSC